MPALDPLLLFIARRSKAVHLVAQNGRSTQVSAQNSPGKVFLQGFWTNALNPGAARFFLAFVPQLIGFGLKPALSDPPTT